MIIAASRSASESASADFPAAVGPQMMRRSVSAKPAVDLVPREMNDRGSTVHVVRWKHGRSERRVERAHLVGRERVARLDCRFACDGRCKSLVSLRVASEPVASERIESFAQTPLSVEARMRHRHGANDERVTAEPFDLKAE